MSAADEDLQSALTDLVFDVRQTTIGGRRVIEKTGTGRSRSRLRREGAALEHLRSAGVVEVVELRETESSTTLVTAYVGARTLADTSMLQPNEILRVVQAVCRVVIGLNDLGWSHGNLSAEHVILGPRARVRLCSFGDAVPLSGSVNSTDFDQLLTLIRQVAEAPATGRTMSERRDWRRMRSRLARAIEDATEGTASEDASKHQIETLLERLSADHEGRHFDGLRRVIPTLHLSPRIRGLVIAVAVLAAGITVLTGVVQRGPDRDVDAAKSGGGRSASARVSATATTADRPLAPATAAGTDTAVKRAAATPADRGPRPPADPGNLVISKGKIYRIGSVDDRVAIGDWNCDGTERALVLRPSTGEVFVYDEWASSSKPSSARLVGIIDGATEFLDAGGVCGPAVVRTTAGSRHQVELPAS